ncbi:MAG: hypothetical protein QOE26_2786 [Verrucomicrobiota bacterium]
MIKLGSIVKDTASGLTGMLTHLQVEMNGNRYMLFQPHGLNPQTGQPVKVMWGVETRFQGGERVEEPKLPLEVLGTEVEDLASGFKGIATGCCLHITGCVHITVQPQGKLTETGGAVDPVEFDMRRLAGPAIKAMSEKARERDQQRKPSPGRVTRYQPLPPR